MDIKIKIVEVRTIPSTTPARLGKTDKLVIYEAGEGNRDSVIVPAEDFTEETVIEAAGKQITERGAWIGKELNVTP